MSIFSIASQSINEVAGTNSTTVSDLFNSSNITSNISATNPIPNVNVSTAISNGLIGNFANSIDPSVRTDIGLLSDFRLGSFLRAHGNVDGFGASVLDVGSQIALDLFRTNKASSDSIKNTLSAIGEKFIPVLIKTDFNLVGNESPFYVIFDSTPESIVFNKTANWQPKEFLGRPEPIQIYGTSSATTFSLTGMFFSKDAIDIGRKNALADNLLALVTPSKNHFIPSPVQVIIGEWKRLRCIVNSVTVSYKGPWWVGGASKNDSGINTQASALGIPLHTPYLFEAVFNFTIVSDTNHVHYAEDIINGDNASVTVTNSTVVVDASTSFNTELNAAASSQGLLTEQSQVRIVDGAIISTVFTSNQLPSSRLDANKARLQADLATLTGTLVTGPSVLANLKKIF